MKKKGIIYAIVAVLFLVICYIIGQTLVGSKSIEKNKKDVYYDYVQKEEQLVYEGDKVVTDAPGGKTVGLVEDDTYGQYYLMTPNTSIRAGIIVDAEPHTLRFQYMIHENVSNISDGMILRVMVIKEGTEDILYDETINVDEKEKEFKLDLSTWKEQNIYIVFSAASMTENQDGDWMVIKDAKIE